MLPRPTSRSPSRGRLIATAILAGIVVVSMGSCGDSPTESMPEVSSVTVEPGSAEVLPEETVTLTATVRDAQGVALTGHTVTWASEDEAVATVDAGGVVTAIMPGSVTIRAQSEGRSGTATVTVTTPPGLPGAIQLPDGVELDPASLTVLSAAGEAHAFTSGDFYLETLSVGTTEVDVLSSSGDLVMFGIADADGSGIEVSASTTARVLLYYALGVFALPVEAQEEVQQFIAESPQVDVLAAAITERMRANPSALTVEDPALVEAIKAARDAVVASASSAPVSTAPGGPADASGADAYADLTIQPNTPQSGVELLAGQEGGLVAMNHYRRPASLLLYRTGYETEDGEVQEVSPPVQVGDALDVPATSRLGVFNAAKDVLTGNAPFDPETSAAIGVPPVEGASETYYTAVLLGPSLDWVSTVPIMEDSRFFGFAAQWDDIIDHKAEEVFWKQFAAAALEAFAFGRVGVIKAAKRQAYVEKARAAADPELLQAGYLLRADGGYARALKLFLEELATGGYRLDLTNVVLDAVEAGEAQRIQLEQVEKRMAKRATAAAVLAAVGVALSSGDIAVTLVHLQLANRGESWKITSRHPQINLNPKSGKVTANERTVSFEAKVNGHPNDIFTFKWSTTGENGEILVEDDDNETPDFAVGSSSRAKYVATAPLLPSGTVDEVTVEVGVRNLDTGEIENIGTATAPIDGLASDYEVTIDPAATSVRGSESIDLHAVVTPAYEGPGLYFRWSTSGNFGSISPPDGEISGLDVVTYTANYGAEGTDQIGVEVLNESLEPIGSASATVDVEGQPDQMINGSFGTETTEDCSFAYIYIPKLYGARYYSMHAYGFTDSTGFWKSPIDRGWSGPGGSIEDLGGQWRFFLSSGCQQGHGSEIEGTLKSRFAGMVIDVTVTF